MDSGAIMAVVTIPTNTDIADQEVTVEIADTTLILRIKWNTRAERWYLSVSDEQESPIFSGVALVRGINYLNLFTDSRLPQVGFLGIIATSRTSGECGRNDLGKGFNIIYDNGESE